MNGKKILIVEDNPQNRELAHDLLEIAGYEVIEAENARIGINKANKDAPDLILMDVQMPGLNGLQAINILKKDNKTKNIPCILVTASATKEDKEHYKIAGSNGYITKPINTRTFVTEIEKIYKLTLIQR